MNKNISEQLYIDPETGCMNAYEDWKEDLYAQGLDDYEVNIFMCKLNAL